MKVAVAPLIAVVAMGILPARHADAQVRARGPVRVVAPRTRTTVVVGPYARAFYGGFYSSFYYDPFFDPFYYRPFYWYPQVGYGPVFYENRASLRVQITPSETEVYIDNYYAGTVDDFDGFFQRLHVAPGSHDVTLHLDGYRTVHQRIYLQPTGTFRLRYTMQQLGPGEVAEPRPVEPPTSPRPQPAGPPPGAAGPFPPPPDGAGGPPREAPTQGAVSVASTISLRVQPANAEVLIDGERWEGPSGDDRLMVAVSPGRHHIEVRRDGYRSYQSDLDVRPGETTTLNVSLTRQ